MGNTSTLDHLGTSQPVFFTWAAVSLSDMLGSGEIARNYIIYLVILDMVKS